MQDITERLVTSFLGVSYKKTTIALTLFLTILSAVPSPFFSSSIVALSVGFIYTPRSILIGDRVNFTATASGGTSPYNFAWDFGDGRTGSGIQIFHTFNSPATYTVKVTVTDSASLTNSISYPVTVQVWPVSRQGWLIHWNITRDDGINIWNTTYHGIPVIRDARIPGVQVIYPSNFCGNFGGPFGAFYDEPFNETGVKADGNIFYENSTDPLNPWFQIRAEYRVGGYYYQEAFRFYSTGRWDTEMTIARGGCAFDHIYEPHWRFNLAVDNTTQNFMSTYTPTGAWQDLIWEGNYTDNGFRDPAHYNTQWRFGDQREYYIVPTIVRADLDLPYLPSNMILVRERPNEIERSHPELGIENPVEFVNGELAFRRNITFWFIPRIWDHGPINGAPPKDIILSFYPYGSWP